VRFRPGPEPRTSFFPAKRPKYGRPYSRTIPEPYRSFILTVLYGFGPYRTVTVPYIRSENGDTAYKHITAHNTATRVVVHYNDEKRCYTHSGTYSHKGRSIQKTMRNGATHNKATPVPEGRARPEAGGSRNKQMQACILFFTHKESRHRAV